MRRFAPWGLLVLALLIIIFTFAGDRSYSNLLSLRNSVARQKRANMELKGRIDELNSEVVGLQTKDRVLEKAAREHLGMVRGNEVIFVFEDVTEGPDKEIQ